MGEKHDKDETLEITAEKNSKSKIEIFASIKDLKNLKTKVETEEGETSNDKEVEIKEDKTTPNEKSTRRKSKQQERETKSEKSENDKENEIEIKQEKASPAKKSAKGKTRGSKAELNVSTDTSNDTPKPKNKNDKTPKGKAKQPKMTDLFSRVSKRQEDTETEVSVDKKENGKRKTE